MTTIVACPKLRVIVCDSQVGNHDQKWSENKVERINGGLYATAGDAAYGGLFYDWIRKGKRGKKPDIGDDFMAIALTRSGLYLYDCNLVAMKRDEPVAIGTGGKCALTAMLCGVDIETAVNAACEVDALSGGPVVVHRLRTTS